MRGWGRKNKVPEFCGPVKRREDLIGQVRNLKDPLSQAQSLASIMARKRARKGTKLSILASASFARELSEKECQFIFELVGWKHGQGKTRS